MPASLRALRLAFRYFFTAVATVVLLIEEWGWKPLTDIAAQIARWPPLARLEARIQAAPPWVALALFLVPAVSLFPLKLAALWLVEQHHAGLGLLLVLAAKLAGTALVGRLFIICEPQLMTFPWFVRALMWWRGVKARLKVALDASPAWQAIRRTERRVRLRGQRWWRLWRRYDRKP